MQAICNKQIAAEREVLLEEMEERERQRDALNFRKLKLWEQAQVKDHVAFLQQRREIRKTRT